MVSLEFAGEFDLSEQESARLKELKGRMKEGKKLLDEKEVSDFLSRIGRKVGEQTAQRLKTLLEDGEEEAFMNLVCEWDLPEPQREELKESRMIVEARRQIFLESARNLHAKQLDLTEAEKQYQNEAR